MYKRLFVTLLTLFFVGAGFSQPGVFNSGDPVLVYNKLAPYGSATYPDSIGQIPANMKKWVYSPTVKNNTDRLPASWDRSKFKCYMWNGLQFRLRFPNNYDSTNPSKYPLVLFWHGGGENGVNKNGSGTIYENQDQLFWGAQTFEQRINAGEWNGFLLFPQTKIQSGIRMIIKM